MTLKNAAEATKDLTASEAITKAETAKESSAILHGQKRKRNDTDAGPSTGAASDSQVRGKPASGRTWKEPAQRSSTRVSVKQLHTTWGQKMQAKITRKTIQAKQNALLDEKKKAKQAERQRIADRQKQREENERKSSVYQKITKTSKIKKMSKKQLKSIIKM
eukprot:CAMPEP_0196652522 /NCGR_PEP_ID=MMETSP1086-20130531/1851_1 /TAXON_ID=77921 /ORGANISM="Cyanoptyche  gloeocystis , Strain SAG4.97" /LENGTH=161 /DNA_ID=CAMNT_0041983121 /DNA_START=88 /DNA_END=573 /DNA_ORIENTATION=+